MAPLLSHTHAAAHTFAPIPRGNRRLAPASHAAGFLRALFPSRPQPAKAELLRLVADQRRGLDTRSDPSPSRRHRLAASAPGTDTVSGSKKLSSTWRLLWTTELEQLFIVRNAPAFRTAAGDVLQVIDVPDEITFRPSGAFVVNCAIEIQPPQSQF